MDATQAAQNALECVLEARKSDKLVIFCDDTRAEIGNAFCSGAKNLKLKTKLIVFKTEPNVFRTEIPLHFASLGTFAANIHSWFDFPQNLIDHLNTGLSLVPIPSQFSGASWEDVLLFLVPTWHEKGTHLPDLDWPRKQINSQEDIKKVPTWAQKGTQLLTKKARYLISILILTSEPIRLKEIMQQMGYKNEKTFRDNYVKPLRKNGLITLTNLEKINDPENRYFITPAGKSFLGGM